MSTFDRRKSLEQLEGHVWPHDEFPSHLVQECQRLRRVPLGELTAEHLRMLIGQKIGLQFLVPLAIEALSENPLLEASYYRGDLLGAVAKVPEEFWAAHAEMNNDFVEIAAEALQVFSWLSEEGAPALRGFQYRESNAL